MDCSRRRASILAAALAISLALLAIGCGSSGEPGPSPDVVRQYSGSDPKGDFIEISINATDQTITEINHTISQTNGPFPYSKASGSQAMGLGILYRAEVNQPTVSYALFAELPGTAVILQLFDSSDKTTGNPQYAVYRQALADSDLYARPYNMMAAKFDEVTTLANKSDMNCGFAAFDSADNSGLLIGAAYSARADKERWTGFPNGVHGFNDGLSVQSLSTDATTLSRYFYTPGGTSWDYRNTLVGTPSGALEVDFSPQGGGGGLFILPQASSKDWNSAYDGTYFLMTYETRTGASSCAISIEPMKCVLSTVGTTKGHIQVYKGTDLAVNGDLKSIADLSAAESPGGTVAITSQLATAAGLGSAHSAALATANQCKGAFVLMDSGSVTFIMLSPDGKIGGFTGFSEGTPEMSYHFGLMIKDPTL